jgi:hypothetical protein
MKFYDLNDSSLPKSMISTNDILTGEGKNLDEILVQ